MKKFAKALSILVIFAMLIALVPKTEAQAAASYKLAAKSKYLFVGGCTGTKANGAKAPFKASYTIKVKGLKSTDKVTYTSKNAKVAKVTKKGKVTAVENGKTKIVVKIKTKAGKTYTRNFTAKVKSNAATVAFDGVKEGQEFEVSTTAYTLKAVATNSKGTASSDLTEFSIADAYKDIASITADGKLTVKAAGEFKVSLRAYQSAKYPGTTASAEIKLVGKAAKGEFAVKQIGPDKVEITLPAAVDSIKAEDFSVKNYSGSTENIKEAKLDASKKDVVTVQLWSTLVAGKEYSFTYAGETVKIIAASLEAKDAASVKVITDTVVVGVSTPLEFKVYNKDGIEIGDQTTMLANVSFTIDGSVGIYEPSEGKIMIFGEGTFPITGAYTYTYVDGSDVKTINLPISFNIKSTKAAAATVSKVEYTVGATSSAVFDTTGFVPNKKIAVGDDTMGINTDLIFRITYTDKTVVSNDSTPFDYDVNDPNMAVISGNTIKPIKTGKVTILVYEPGTKNLVGSFDVEIGAERVPASVSLNVSKKDVNTFSSMIDEKIVFTASVTDNYGSKMDTGVTIDYEIKSKTGDANIDFSAASSAWVDKFYVTKADAATAVTGEGSIVVIAKAKVGTKEVASSAVSFTCKKVDTATEPDNFKVIVENSIGGAGTDNTIMDIRDINDYRLTVNYSGFKGNYRVTGNSVAKFDTGTYPSNTTGYYYQVLLGSTALSNKSGYSDNFIDGSIYTISTKSHEISKLATGTYTVKLYKVVTDASGKVTSKKAVDGGSATFSVLDSQPGLSVSKLKDKISAMNEATLKSERAFSVVYGSKPAKVLLSEDVSADPDLSFKTTDGSTSMYVSEVSYKVFLADGTNYFVVSAPVGVSILKN